VTARTTAQGRRRRVIQASPNGHKRNPGRRYAGFNSTKAASHRAFSAAPAQRLAPLASDGALSQPVLVTDCGQVEWRAPTRKAAR
jgi:hypothetical protein